jgi:hypothetical protein
MKKWMFGILAVVLIAGLFAIAGCTTVPVAGPAGPAGPEGPAGPAGECDCDVVGGTASLFIGATGCAGVDDEVEVTVKGAGFSDGALVTLYFASEGSAKELKWFKVEANEVGAFCIDVTVPNETTLRDVLLDITTTDGCCGDDYVLTVNAFEGGTLAATAPLVLAAD